MSKQARIGLSNLVVWPMIDEETETYGEVKAIPEAKTATINPRTSSSPEYGDDIQVDEIESFDGCDFTIENRYLTTEILALIHGHQLDEKGVLDKSMDDRPPFIAIAFKSLKRDGTYRYVLLPKCKAKLGQETYKTVEGKKEVQTETTTFACMPRKRDKKWERIANEGDTGLDKTVIQNWFKVPYGETVGD